jgi:NADH-quinone oxidoreductase subunit A
MLDQYLPIFIMLVLGALFAALSFVASSILAPKSPNAAKRAPYECGIVPRFEPPERFPVRFYLVAMVFIVFDIEIVFLYPWAVDFRLLGTFGLVEIIVFAAAVVVSFLYLLRHGVLDWGPARRFLPEPVQEPVRSKLLDIDPEPPWSARDVSEQVASESRPGEAA